MPFGVFLKMFPAVYLGTFCFQELFLGDTLFLKTSQEQDLGTNTNCVP